MFLKKMRIPGSVSNRRYFSDLNTRNRLGLSNSDIHIFI